MNNMKKDIKLTHHHSFSKLADTWRDLKDDNRVNNIIDYLKHDNMNKTSYKTMRMSENLLRHKQKNYQMKENLNYFDARHKRPFT
jgi:hypothetical protein